jgi:hypothetical protein
MSTPVTLLERAELCRRGLTKSRTQTWRAVQSGLLPPPPWAEHHIDLYSRLVASGVDRREATRRVEALRSAERAELLASLPETAA